MLRNSLYFTLDQTAPEWKYEAIDRNGKSGVSMSWGIHTDGRATCDHRTIE